MSPAPKDPIVDAGRKLLDRFNSGIGLLSWRLMVLILFALCYFEGKNMLNAFIETSPAMKAAGASVQEAKDAVAVAKSTADTANAKADQSLAIQAKIFDAIKQGHEDTETIKLSLAAFNSTITAQVADLGKQLDRVESRQDAAKQ